MTTPTIKLIGEENGELSFTLKGVDVSIANALRRTMLSDIQVVVIDHTKAVFDAPDGINTTDLHNEILKQRLACIPVYITRDFEPFVEGYTVECDVINRSDEEKYVTTGDFQVRNAKGDIVESQRIFPKNELTQAYIDLVRLAPHMVETVEPERLKFKAPFKLGTGAENGCYSAVSKSTYFNTIDREKAASERERLIEAYTKESTAEPAELKKQLVFVKNDFDTLDAQRYFVPNSFDFTIETIGQFSNKEIFKKACNVMQSRLIELVELANSDELMIVTSDYLPNYSTMDNSYDVILAGHDTTVGNVLVHLLMESMADTELCYCAFTKFHPADPKGVLRCAFERKTTKEEVKGYLVEALRRGIALFKTISQIHM
jgi:DNA-directed RNA polymerase subunit L